jgi:hypothetical protein
MPAGYVEHLRMAISGRWLTNRTRFSLKKRICPMASQYEPATDEILSILRSPGQQTPDIKLSANFKGVLLDQEITILEVGPNSAAFQGSNIKYCAGLEGMVFLQSSIFPCVVAARMANLDVTKGIILLSHFAYTKLEWKNSRSERVQPKEPAYALLRWNQGVLRFSIENISASGLEVLSNKINRQDLDIQPGTEVKLDFQIPPNYKYSNLEGEIIYLQPIGNRLVRAGIQLYPKADEAVSLVRLVEQRREEIMEELHQAYMVACRPRSAACLFF